MKFIHELEILCKVCINHFNELCKDNEDKIRVFSISLESQSIWGGNGDRDTDKIFYITQNGWVEHILTQEYGMYQKGDGITQSSFNATTSSSIEADINSDKPNIYDIKELFNFYNQIRDTYPNEFK